MTYQNNTLYLYYWAPISFTFTVDSSRESHSPLLLPRWRQRISVGESLPVVVEKYYFDSWLFCCIISFLKSVSISEWSLEQNLMRPHKVTTGCPVTTHDVVQLPFAAWFRSGIDTPAWLTRNSVIVQSGMCSVAPWKRSGRNSSWKEFYTGLKSSSSTWV